MPSNSVSLRSVIFFFLTWVLGVLTYFLWVFEIISFNNATVFLLGCLVTMLGLIGVGTLD